MKYAIERLDLLKEVHENRLQVLQESKEFFSQPTMYYGQNHFFEWCQTKEREAHLAIINEEIIEEKQKFEEISEAIEILKGHQAVLEFMKY